MITVIVKALLMMNPYVLYAVGCPVNGRSLDLSYLTVIPARVGQKMRVLAADYKIDFFNKVDKLKKML